MVGRAVMGGRMILDGGYVMAPSKVFTCSWLASNIDRSSCMASITSVIHRHARLMAQIPVVLAAGCYFGYIRGPGISSNLPRGQVIDTFFLIPGQ